MAFSEDFSVFFNDDTPGFRKMVVNSVPVDGIFDNDFEKSNFVETSNPIFWAASSDLTSVVHGVTVVDGADSYSVIGVEPDNSGVTGLVLRKAD